MPEEGKASNACLDFLLVQEGAIKYHAPEFQVIKPSRKSLTRRVTESRSKRMWANGIIDQHVKTGGSQAWIQWEAIHVVTVSGVWNYFFFWLVHQEVLQYSRHGSDHYSVTQAGLELILLLPQHLSCWVYRHCITRLPWDLIADVKQLTIAYFIRRGGCPSSAVRYCVFRRAKSMQWDLKSHWSWFQDLLYWVSTQIFRILERVLGHNSKRYIPWKGWWREIHARKMQWQLASTRGVSHSDTQECHPMNKGRRKQEV